MIVHQMHLFFRTTLEILTLFDELVLMLTWLSTSQVFWVRKSSLDCPREAIDININGAMNVLLACANSRVPKRVFLPTKPNEWNNIYSMTAQAVEKLGHVYRENSGLDVRVLRLWNVYGPRQRLFPVRKAVPLFIFQALRNRPVEVFGDGSSVVELMFVEDVAKTIADFTLHRGPASDTYEIRSGVQISVDELARRIVQMVGSRSEVIHVAMRKGERPGSKFGRALDVRNLLGESPITSFDLGMEKTIEWYRNNIWKYS